MNRGHTDDYGPTKEWVALHYAYCIKRIPMPFRCNIVKQNMGLVRDTTKKWTLVRNAIFRTKYSTLTTRHNLWMCWSIFTVN